MSVLLRSTLYRSTGRLFVRPMQVCNRLSTFIDKDRNCKSDNSPAITSPLAPFVGVASISALAGSTSFFLAETAATSTAYPIPGALATILQFAGPACFFFLQVSGLKTVSTIKKQRTTADLSILPFISLFSNCVIWTTYGVLIQDMTVLVPNFTGALLGAYYTTTFVQHATKPQTKELVVGGGLAAGAVVSALAFPTDMIAPYIGYTGCAVAVFLMGSPLATMATVLKEKSTRAMPFATSFATFLNAAAWTSYGVLVAGNPIIWVPNVLGLAAASVQMSLFARFGIYKGE